MKMMKAIGIAVVIGAGLMFGCTAPSKPDLGRLYATDSAVGMQPPVIVIPGILGSRLREQDSGREVWPGSPRQLLFGDYRRLALRIDPTTLEPIDDGIEAYDIFDQLMGSDYYGNLLKTLATDGHFTRTQPGTVVRDRRRRYYVFAYDWRQDNVLTARKLDALIEQIRVDHGDADLRVDIVAHSMGGLITRYYLRYGAADVLDDNDLPITYVTHPQISGPI